jgi:hypothetical protein
VHWTNLGTVWFVVELVVVTWINLAISNMCAFVWYVNSLNSKKSIVGILTFSAELASYLCRRRWVLGSITCRILSEIFWNTHCIFVQQLCDFPVLTSKPNLASAFALKHLRLTTWQSSKVHR